MLNSPAVISALAVGQRIAADASALVVRLTIGQAFLLTGLGKLRNHERTADYFNSLGIPFAGLQAWFVGGLELIGGGLLILGLVTRPIATLLLGTMAVAILTADRTDFLGALALSPEKGLTDVVPWMFGLLLMALIAHGAGRLSLDQLLFKKKQPSA
jgi:putative oxidoreductase